LDFALSFLLPQATILWKRTSLFFIGIILMLAGGLSFLRYVSFGPVFYLRCCGSPWPNRH
jgi:hypothetical protein